MASNWIKVEVITPDKPEIFLISEKLNIDPDMVLGKLIRLWVWADQQIAISNADSVTDSEQMERKSNASVLSKIAIDRIAFMPGFADALIYAGWLIQEGDSLFFVNFEKHNGKSSKNRALTNERVNKSRNLKRNGNDKSNAVNVTHSNQKALPEEEEEEEEDKELKDPPIPPKGKPDAKSGYTSEFEDAWANYPKRAGGNSKQAAFKAWNARIKSGVPVQDMIDGVKRYAAYITATGKQHTEYVQQTATFFGRSCHYENDWQIPKSGGAYGRDVNQLSQPDNSVPPGFRG